MEGYLGIGILEWIFAERYAMEVMHAAWAIADAVMLLFSAVTITVGTLSSGKIRGRSS